MGTLASGLDEAMRDMGIAAGGMLSAAWVFPECLEISKVGGFGIGGPGTLIEGAQFWLEGASALQQAQQALTDVVGGLGPDQWSGIDRDGFDKAIEDLQAQLGISHNYAQMVGAVLAGLATPLLAFPPVFLTAGITMLSWSIAYEIALASVYGAPAAPGIYASGTAIAATFFAVVNGFVYGIVAAMAAAAVAIEIADAVDVTQQKKHGDTDAGETFKQAQVDGLGEVAENVEAWGVGRAASWAGGKVGKGTIGQNPADELARWAVGTGVGTGINNLNKAGQDVVNGESPGRIITDGLGITNQVNLAEAAAKQAKDSGEEILEQLPDNLGELINKGVNYKDH